MGPTHGVRDRHENEHLLFMAYWSIPNVMDTLPSVCVSGFKFARPL